MYIIFWLIITLPLLVSDIVDIYEQLIKKYDVV